MTFANSLNPDQALQHIEADMDPNCLTLMIFLNEFFEKVDFEKSQQMTKKHAKLPSRDRVKVGKKKYSSFVFFQCGWTSEQPDQSQL